MKKIIVALAGLLGAVYFIAFHWQRFLSDFWPVDKATVAPNITAAVVQYVLLGIGAYLLYPPVKRAVNKWVVAHLRSQSNELHSRLDTVEALAKHIIKHHPNIPNHVPGVGDVTVDAKPGESPATPPPTSPAGS